MMKLNRSRIAPLSILLVLVGAAHIAAAAMWVEPSDWPVERLIQNLERFLAEHPDDADATYNLGRIHGYAFALETNSLGAWAANEDQPPMLPGLDLQRALYDPTTGSRRRPDDPRPGAGEILRHLSESVRLHRKAIELAPERAEFHLGLAYVLETGSHVAEQVDTSELLGLPSPTTGEDVSAVLRLIEELGSDDAAVRESAFRELLVPESLARSIPYLVRERGSKNSARRDAVVDLIQRYWLDRAIDEYYRAFELALDADLAVEQKPQDVLGVRLDLLVSYEAGQSYLRLARRRGVTEPGRLEAIEKSLKMLEEKPVPTWITPIVLALEENRSLAELLADGVVSFDLDGDLESELWPWVRPSTGFLVWDPAHRGALENARSMFGSASGWFFFPDGYRVLAALDDDGDGWLRGAELAGIAVWFDRDSDGLSDLGEVIPIEALAIVGLATHATGQDGRSLVNPLGLELADGRRLPTYDWVTAPIAAAGPRS